MQRLLVLETIHRQGGKLRRKSNQRRGQDREYYRENVAVGNGERLSARLDVRGAIQTGKSGLLSGSLSWGQIYLLLFRIWRFLLSNVEKYSFSSLHPELFLSFVKLWPFSIHSTTPNNCLLSMTFFMNQIRSGAFTVLCGISSNFLD